MATLTTTLKRTEPCTKLTGVLGGPDNMTFDLLGLKRLNRIKIIQSIKRVATNVSQFTDALGQIVFKIADNAQRTRYAAELFDVQGLNALNDIMSAGMVVYTQAGNANLSRDPVLIGSAADLVQRGLVGIN
jgi:hypothetical protein